MTVAVCQMTMTLSVNSDGCSSAKSYFILLILSVQFEALFVHVLNTSSCSIISVCYLCFTSSLVFSLSVSFVWWPNTKQELSLWEQYNGHFSTQYTVC